MAKSLQDQLRKAGLVSDQKARQTRADKRKKGKQVRSGVTDDEAVRRTELAKATKDKAEHDRKLNRERQAELDARAIAAQVTQMIQMNIVERGDDEASYSYEHDGRIKTFALGSKERAALTDGRLALALNESTAVLVPAGAARKIADRDAARILVLNDGTSAAEDAGAEDDPYADFKVPDDLMW